jgi:hypothetical protein
MNGRIINERHLPYEVARYPKLANPQACSCSAMMALLLHNAAVSQSRNAADHAAAPEHLELLD